MPNICRLLIFSDCRQLAKNKLQNFKIFGNFLFFQIVVSWQKINSKTYHRKTYLRWRKFCLSYLLEDWRNIFFPLIRLSSLGITGYYLAGHRKWKFFQLCQKIKNQFWNFPWKTYFTWFCKFVYCSVQDCRFWVQMELSKSIHFFISNRVINN